jgi:hypothetical protein
MENVPSFREMEDTEKSSILKVKERRFGLFSVIETDAETDITKIEMDVKTILSVFIFEIKCSL